jgi:dTDP-4-dehydrorhamnose 3,5-epimerase
MTVQLITPRRFGDSRGWFAETFRRDSVIAMGIDADFCQDNHSYSAAAGTLRGLHFQREPHAQAKLVRCTRGSIFDVAVDLRPESPTYRQCVSTVLTAVGGEQLFVPRGFGHGFLTLEPDCEVQYKVDDYYAPAADGGVRWDDPILAIDWPRIDGLDAPILSDKDAGLPLLTDLTLEFAYDGRPLLPLS